MSRISQWRRPIGILVAIILAFALALSTTILAFASVTLLQLSSDPFPNIASQHRTEVDPDTFAAGSSLVSVFQVGRIFGGGAADIGFATSTDGGKSFTSGFLPDTTTAATPPGIYAAVSDASVAFDARHGVWLTSYLGISPNGNTSEVDVLVSRSTDGGLTWSKPVVVNNSGHFNDKNWTVCDDTASSPFYGHCYTEFDDNTKNDLIQMSTSSDGGQTWGAALPTANHAHGIGGQPLVQPGGTVIVPIEGFASRNGDMMSFTSTDGGASWNAGTKIAAVPFYFYPNANCTASTCQLEVGYATSADGGATWTSDTQIAGPMSLSWIANTSQGRMVGDYISTSFVGGPAFPAFEVASAPAGSTFNEATFTVKGGLSVGGSGKTASDHFNAGSNDTLTGSSLTAQ